MLHTEGQYIAGYSVCNTQISGEYRINCISLFILSIPIERRPCYLNIVIPFAVNGVVVPATVKLLRVPSCLLASFERLGVRLLVEGICKYRDHKQVDDEAGRKRKGLIFN